MSRRITRSRSRSMSRGAEHQELKPKVGAKKQHHQLKGISETTTSSSSSSSSSPKKLFQHYVTSMKDFIQKIDNLQDAEETIVNENYEKLSETYCYNETGNTG